MRRSVPPLALFLLTATLALAADRPVRGDRILLRSGRAGPGHPTAKIVLRDPSIAPPFSAFAGGVLRLSGGAAEGQCHVEVRLAESGWRAIGGQGAALGYTYRGDTARGLVRVAIRPGLLTVRVRGGAWPCTLGGSQRTPVYVELRLGGDRYCAGFGGGLIANALGRFAARGAPAPGACGKNDISAATLNILHGAIGAGCQASSNCRLSDRVDLLFRWIAASGCPDVVTLQEVRDLDPGNILPLIEARLATACPFRYETARRVHNHNDDALVISRFPIVATELRVLQRGFRAAMLARIDHPVGPLDVFTTHLASGGDGANLPCGTGCPAECVTAGAATVRDCQAVQVARFVEDRHTSAAPAIVTGDFNEEPGSFVYRQFTERGWADVHLGAGNPECDPLTGTGCTSGRDDQGLDDLESPASNLVERIDYIFAIPPRAGSTCAGKIDSAADDDGDGIATKIFTDDPNPFAPSCGPLPAPICWPSDHEGVQLDLNCAD